MTSRETSLTLVGADCSVQNFVISSEFLTVFEERNLLTVIERSFNFLPNLCVGAFTYKTIGRKGPSFYAFLLSRTIMWFLRFIFLI